MIPLIIVLIILLMIIAAFWSTYNSLVKLDERVNEAWSDITVQLKYRADLIPNVVETVKGYAKHEKEVFEGVTEARSAVMGAKSVKGAAKAEAEMTNALSKVFAIAEAYPELKANSNFQKLQEQLRVRLVAHISRIDIEDPKRPLARSQCQRGCVHVSLIDSERCPAPL